MPMYNGVAEAPRGNSPDGPDQSKGPPPRDSRDLPSLMLSSCYPITLKFMDVGYKVKFENRNKGSNIKRVLGCAPKISDQTQERTILNGITGMASPGEILAILGPSGSGKSTFLNALAGRIQSSSFTGTILANSRKPTKQIMKRTVLVLSEGRGLYFGKGSEAMSYFQSTGYSPSFPMNPADFLLDLANGVCQTDGASEREKPNVKQSLIASYNTLLAPKAKAAFMETRESGAGSYNSEEHRSSSDRISMAAWFSQFSILLQRSLKERKHESFNTLRVFQVIMAAVFAGLMWWRSDYRDVQDRLGLLFFMSIFWGVFPSSNSVFVFPQERAIFLKERASGMYSLSSYFTSRIVGDLPMELILPTIFLSVTYWMAGLKPEPGAFLSSLLVLLGYVLVSQGLGLALGAAMMDAKKASTIVTITMLAFVLTGGFYVHKLPPCIAWIKYISTTFYSYRLLINVQYGEGEKLSSLLGCSLPHGSDSASCKFVEQDVAGQISPAISVSVLIFMFVGYRLLAYLALRRIKA
ncbi:hypothetical protein OIU85_004406 [Salix viminalis]|uniref:ABC transporter domain-containing protein n=1 Tax=Salix viminalis TaxID=40686 RepID=A0A9Q0PSH8_SALVM|nr:hypothetical protein OIU85_004406 [Salix viminalis]